MKLNKREGDEKFEQLAKMNSPFKDQLRSLDETPRGSRKRYNKSIQHVLSTRGLNTNQSCYIDSNDKSREEIPNQTNINLPLIKEGKISKKELSSFLRCPILSRKELLHRIKLKKILSSSKAFKKDEAPEVKNDWSKLLDIVGD